MPLMVETGTIEITAPLSYPSEHMYFERPQSSAYQVSE